MQDENRDVRRNRVKAAVVDDARAARPRGRIKPLDRLAHEKRLAGEVGVVGAGRGARLDERHPVTPVRPDGRGDRSRPRRELGERNAVLGVRDDQGPIRRPRAKLATHAFELLPRAPGEADAHSVRRRAREILRRELPDKASRAEEDDIQVTHLAGTLTISPPSRPTYSNETLASDLARALSLASPTAGWSAKGRDSNPRTTLRPWFSSPSRSARKRCRRAARAHGHDDLLRIDPLQQIDVVPRLAELALDDVEPDALTG